MNFKEFLKEKETIEELDGSFQYLEPTSHLHHNSHNKTMLEDKDNLKDIEELEAENKKLKDELAVQTQDIQSTQKDKEDSNVASYEYPDGVYIRTNLSESTIKNIDTYIEKNLKGLKEEDINRDYHCTIIFSKEPYEYKIDNTEFNYTGTSNGFDLFGEDKNCLVLKVNSQELINRNIYLTKKYKFISDWDYSPHITFAYNINTDINSLPELDFILEFENEIVQNVNLDYAKSKDEEELEEQNELTESTEFNWDRLSELLNKHNLSYSRPKCMNVGNITVYNTNDENNTTNDKTFPNTSEGWDKVLQYLESL